MTSRTPSRSSKSRWIEVTMNADRAENGVRCACGPVYVKTAGDKAVNYILNLGVCCALLHHDNHWLDSVLLDSSKKASVVSNQFPVQGKIKNSTRKNPAIRSCIFLLSVGMHGGAFGSARFVIMRSNRRRIAASVSGPRLLRSAFSRTSFSRPVGRAADFAAA